MKKSKWVFFIVGISIFAGSLIGCVGGNNQKEINSNGGAIGSKDGSAAAVKAIFWADKLTEAETAKKITDVWSVSSGLKIDLNAYSDTASYQTAISQSINNAGAAPDAFFHFFGACPSKSIGLKISSTYKSTAVYSKAWETV